MLAFALHYADDGIRVLHPKWKIDNQPIILILGINANDSPHDPLLAKGWNRIGVIASWDNAIVAQFVDE